MGLERAAPVRTLVQKLRTVEQFLARGRVHRRKTHPVKDVGFLLFGVPIKDGYFDRVAVLIVFAIKQSISGVFLTFERNIKRCSAIYAPI